MRQFITFLLCLALGLGHFSAAQAGGLCHFRARSSRQVVAQHTNVQAKFVVPYAVALGVPVANFSHVAYSYNGNPYLSSNAATDGQIKQAVKEALIELLGDANGNLTTQGSTPAVKPSLIGQNCAACHTGAAAKGGFRVDLPLDDSARLRASRAVLTGQMPKGTSLDEQTRGDLLGELVGGIE